MTPSPTRPPRQPASASGGEGVQPPPPPSVPAAELAARLAAAALSVEDPKVGNAGSAPEQERPPRPARKPKKSKKPAPAEPSVDAVPPRPELPAAVAAARFDAVPPADTATRAYPVAADPIPVVEPEPEPVVELEPVVDPDEAREPEPETAVMPELESEAVVEPEPESELEPEAEIVVEPEPGIVEPEVESELEPEVEIAVQPEPELRAKPEIERERAPEPELGPEPVLGSRSADDATAVFAAAVPNEDAREPAAVAEVGPSALTLTGVSKSFGQTRAVDSVDLEIPAGTFYGIVGPNGAGKTTTLSMIAGLLRPDAGEIRIAGIDLRADPRTAKSLMGVLPDRLRTFDRLTGRQLLHYYGVLRGLRPAVVAERTADLGRAFDLTAALTRPVSDYSAGMTKKIMLAGAMIHAPRLLVLDEPFESVDPVSSAVILDILSAYVARGGTVVLSSHGMDLVERVCDGVAVIVAGQVLARGTVDEVKGDHTLAERFVQLSGGLSDVEGLEWLHTYSD